MPMIPVIPLYLRDLTFIEDGNPSWNEEKTHLTTDSSGIVKESKYLNVNKMEMLGKILKRNWECQNSTYQFWSVFTIQDYMDSFPLQEQTDLEKRVKILENSD